jgi:hypothetical protein
MSRKRKSGKPIGGGGARNPASIANLRRGLPAPIGNARAMTHGFQSEALVKDVSDEVRELAALIAETVPVKDPDGSAPAADTLAIEAAAVALKRWRSVHQWCELHGRLTDKGEVKPAANYELEGERALHRCLDALGLSPMARSKLGLNIARTAGAFDLARHWQDQGDG